ncbi:T9SS type B sorting domain-containing protein [Algibacter miyuki]|uniref:T9SS type B sorting domain-containing protein n=1 Tax=Algibacter miyuki TaxID=1306933 RepID=UPI00366EA432|nr:T9SS type B sorting domain-containing protein [Algibacter miyuki]
MRYFLSFFFLVSTCFLSAQITLTNNIGNVLVETNMLSCEEDESWARVFKLSDFGISNSQQFIIHSGQVGISKSYNGAYLSFGVFGVDASFPNSNPIPLSGGGNKLLPEIVDGPQIVEFDFINPLVVPAGIERILVVVSKRVDFYNPNSAEVGIAGTADDSGVSWYKGCRKYYDYIPTTDIDVPVPNANFFINVTGEAVDIRSTGPTTRLTHNVCDDLVKTINNSCSYSYVYAGRDFYLNDFGISENEEYTITEGQLAYSYAEWGAAVQFNIYEIDDNFPDSFSESSLIGSSQLHGLGYFNTSGAVRTENIKFDTPVVVPAGTKRIFVEVLKGLKGGGSGLLHIAGTKVDDGAPTWYKGCYTSPTYINSDEITRYALWPGEDYKFYINVTGNVNHITNNFEMNISNICSEFLKEFSVENKANVASVVWDFGDSPSGVDNTSTDLSPFHDFSADGTYTIKATVVGKDGSVEVLEETIDVTEPPMAYGINDFYSCEDAFGSGMSSSFNLSGVQKQVLGGQSNKVVTFIDGSGNEYSTLPSAFSNTIRDRETIAVRVAHQNNPCCYSETTFDLIVNALPNLSGINDLKVCDNNTNGYAKFDLEAVESDVLIGNPNTTVSFYYENGSQISAPLSAVENLVKNEEVIKVRATHTITKCYNETTFKLMVNPLPVAYALNALIGCDDNNDGISEYFDITDIETEVLGSQTGLEVSYFDSFGNILPKPLPNPYTNTKANEEIITVRVLNTVTGCFAETPLVLKTATQPEINKPETIYACNEGNGFAFFDTAQLEAELIGSQNGLKILYFDKNRSALPSPLPTAFKNTEAWSQTIYVRVENALNSLCYSETTFDLVVNDLPQINLQDEYFLCDLEPFLKLALPGSFNSWEWTFEDGTVLSNNFEVNLIEEGDYVLKVSELKNGIICENEFQFRLIRSQLPEITKVNYKELSDQNFIEIIASGDGDFEYSIDGVNYQDSAVFSNVSGGVYEVSVRDKKGCGQAFESVSIIDYPKFFTPNDDGVNDVWLIKGLKDYPNAVVSIFDRYGKLLKQIKSNSEGWDGTISGSPLQVSDYWFTAILDENIRFSGHFTLKR